MLKLLTYFNLIYGTSLFILAIKGTDWDILTIVAFLIVLLYNWVVLKELEGMNVTTRKNRNILKISTLIVALIILLNSLLLLSMDYGDGSSWPVLLFCGLKIVFVATVSYHALKSRRIKFID